MDRCEIRRCRAEASIVYLGHGVCERHWDQLTAEDAPPDALRMGLGIETTTQPAMEEDMGGSIASKSRTKAPKAKATKTAKESRPKREKVDNPVVFAFRLSAEQRDLIHKAAGSGKATRFVRGAALAAAQGDTKGFQELTAQATANLK